MHSGMKLVQDLMCKIDRVVVLCFLTFHVFIEKFIGCVFPISDVHYISGRTRNALKPKCLSTTFQVAICDSFGIW